MKSICIITSKYPTHYNNSALVFVQQLAWAFADIGINCTVICPIAVNIDGIQGVNLPFRNLEKTSRGNEIIVYHPKYIGFGQQNFYIMNTAVLTLVSFTGAVKKVINQLPEIPDIIYGHFITPSGITAARIGREYNIPAFLAYGESSPWSIKNIGLNKVEKELKTLSGVVSVSTQNKEKLINLGVINPNKIEVFPNAIRAEHFFPRNKREARSKFGFPLDAFIIAFVGHFIKRKGIDKLIQVIKEIDGVYAIYAGKGPISPQDEKTLYFGPVNPVDLPWFYSAADLFVLPTLNEGCCNAIIEAMACGLPIISSNLPFNDDILDESCSIRVNPLDVEEIKNAILTLYNDRIKLEELRKGSIENAKRFTLENRAKNIIQFIDQKIIAHNEGNY